MSPEACALLADSILAEAEPAIDDDVVLAQLDADWAQLMRELESDWRL